MSRENLYARYRQLVDDELPGRARAGRWVVTADSCSGRILLVHAVAGCWYGVLDRRRSPTAAQLDDDRLAAAVALAERPKDLPAPQHSFEDSVLPTPRGLGAVPWTGPGTRRGGRPGRWAW